MKTRSQPLLAATLILACGTSAWAQTVDKSTGTVLDSSTAPAVAVGNTELPSTLTASLTAATEGGKIAGTLKFSMAGNAANVTGRIEGLEPNKSYQLALGPMTDDMKADNDMEKKSAKAVAPAPSHAPPPNAPKSMAPAPAAPAPDAPAPNGEPRPGARGAGNETTSVTGSSEPIPDTHSAEKPEAPAGSGDAIGSVVADSTGGTNVNAVLRNEATADSLQNLAGRTVIVRGGEGTEMMTVAWGVIAGPVGGPEKAKPTKEAAAAPADR